MALRAIEDYRAQQYANDLTSKYFISDASFPQKPEMMIIEFTRRCLSEKEGRVISYEEFYKRKDTISRSQANFNLKKGAKFSERLIEKTANFIYDQNFQFTAPTHYAKLIRTLNRYTAINLLSEVVGINSILKQEALAGGNRLDKKGYPKSFSRTQVRKHQLSMLRMETHRRSAIDGRIIPGSDGVRHHFKYYKTGSKRGKGIKLDSRTSDLIYISRGENSMVDSKQVIKTPDGRTMEQWEYWDETLTIAKEYLKRGQAPPHWSRANRRAFQREMRSMNHIDSFFY